MTSHYFCGQSVDSNGLVNSQNLTAVSPATMKDGVPLTDTDSQTTSIRTGSKKIGGYAIGRTIGEGSFAKVKEGVHILTNQRVAIKVVDKAMLKSSEYLQRNFRREAAVLQKLSHPNVVKLFEVLETENHYYLVMELAKGGELMNHICAVDKLSEREARKFLRQIVSAIDYMHKAGVVHRDLKVENMLLDEHMNIKIIDFGLSNTLGQGNCLMTQCGSPAYAAPEVFCQKAYGPAVDVWSIGVNLYAMLTGELPFHVEPINMTALHAQILLGAKIPETLSESSQDLLSQLLQQKEEKRIKMAAIMTHPWLNEGYPNDPLEPAPFPAFKTPDQLNGHILTRMAERLGYAREEVVKSICENKASAASATYHLLEVMFNGIVLRRKLSGGLRYCFSDSQLDMELDIIEPRQHNAMSLRTEPSSSFKEAAKALKQSESVQIQKQSGPGCIEAGRASRLNIDSKPQSKQVERAVPGIHLRRFSCSTNGPTSTLLLRRASTNTMVDGRRQFGKRSGLQLTTASPGKSHGTHSRGSSTRWGQDNKLERCPAQGTTRLHQRKQSLSDQIPPHSDTGTETYRMNRDIFSPVIEEPAKLPRISGSSLIGLNTSRTPRSPRSKVRNFTQLQQQMKL